MVIKVYFYPDKRLRKNVIIDYSIIFRQGEGR